MTFAGYIGIDDQLEHVDLEMDDTVNPFIVVRLNQINFSAILLESRQLYLPPWYEDIYIIPSIPGNHVPASFYRYLYDNFILKICYKYDIIK